MGLLKCAGVVLLVLLLRYGKAAWARFTAPVIVFALGIATASAQEVTGDSLDKERWDIVILGLGICLGAYLSFNTLKMAFQSIAIGAIFAFGIGAVNAQNSTHFAANNQFSGRQPHKWVFTLDATGCPNGSYFIVMPGQTYYNGWQVDVTNGQISWGLATREWTENGDPVGNYNDMVTYYPNGYKRSIFYTAIYRENVKKKDINVGKEVTWTPVKDGLANQETTVSNHTIYMGDAPPEKTVTVRIAVKSTCPDGQPFTFTVGGQTQTGNPPTGTIEAPSEIETMTKTFTLETITASQTWSIKTSTGAILDHGTLADGNTSGNNVTVGSYFYLQPGLPNSFRTITCAQPPPPVVDTSTDGTTGDTTENKTQGKTNDTGTGKTDTTESTKTPPPTPPAGPGETPVPSAPEKTKSQKTTFYSNPATEQMTKQDFYDATRQALLDAAASSGGELEQGNSVEAPAGTTEELQDVGEAEEGLRGKVTEFFEGFASKFDGVASRFDVLPTPSQTLILDFGDVPRLGAVRADLSAFASIAAAIRQMLLLAISCVFVWKSIKRIGEVFA